ncbi:hypothetical protein PCNPT3_11555 [Psychromonas sp. CNPT3]|uniref:tetratricopeptide repeat protein n=1 Tax=Psychromonas sp. CNPT3 TaxID=314282 RepID=UPI0002C121AA|nr:tetratricopeptide repeat protein [Psychromonas sp. CNPT3]AGH82247.1 hypothetical protein PCNPT3_11555 [Psychromonas sp. CNPT3]
MEMIIYTLRKYLYITLNLIAIVCDFARIWVPALCFIYMFTQSDGSSAEWFLIIIETAILGYFGGIVVKFFGLLLLVVNDYVEPNIENYKTEKNFPILLVLRNFGIGLVVTFVVFYFRSMTTVLPEGMEIKSNQNKRESPTVSVSTKKERGNTSKTNWDNLYLLPGKNFYFEKLNIKHSYQYLITAARKGDSEAKIRVAILYMHGIGVKQNFEKAKYWFEQSANDNHPQGQKMYGYTLYGTQNSEAFKYIKKAALQGDLEAQYLTSKFYLDGIGVKKDKEKSEYWFQKAIAKDIF